MLYTEIVSTMESMQISWIIVLFCLSLAFCYPSKPLNERSASQLTWQAWLLVDDQNQNKQQQNLDGVPRRRITPKSVFIAPTFTPETLPPCAQGYSSDIMGRCVPVINLNQDAQMEFLLQQLNQQFGTDYGDDNYSDEDSTKSGPLQLTIPLVDENPINSGEEEAANIAIIVTPTRGVFEKIDYPKRGVGHNLDEATTTTVSSTTPDMVSTTTINNFDTNTDAIVTETVTPTTTTESVITSTNMEDVMMMDETQTTVTESTSTEMTTSTEEIPITTITASKRIRFPDDLQVSNQEEKPLMDLIKFPDDNVPSQHNTRDTTGQQTLGELFGNDRVVPPNRSVLDLIKPINSDHISSQHQPLQRPEVAHHHRRNRDKNNNLFHLPPNWSESSPQKPLVLRFSRKHAYVDPRVLKAEPDYYRFVSNDDLAYIFGYSNSPNKHLNNRHFSNRRDSSNNNDR